MGISQNKFESSEKGAWLSIIAYVTLAILKIFVGNYAHSEALVADGFNNSSDFVVSLAVLIGLKISKKPADRYHKYGHSRAETISALVASLLMMIVGIQVFVQALRSFISPAIEKPDVIAAWTGIISAIIIYLVYRYNRKLAIKTKSHALMAAAQDNRSDALVSIGAATGILGAQYNLNWLDPIMAQIVAVMILKTAIEIFIDTSRSLTDGYPEEDLFKYKRSIEKIPGVEAVHDIKARTHGSNVLVDITIHVNPKLDVMSSHTIADEIENKLKELYHVKNVHIHIEPSENQN